MKATRQEIYAAIDGEREHQNTLCARNQWSEAKTIGEFLLTIECLIDKAKESWYMEPDLQASETLNNMRKIAATAVACMEEHGVLKRVSYLSIEKELGNSESIKPESYMQVVIKSEAGEDEVSEAHLIVGDTVNKII